MSEQTTRIVLLGSTGSIGTQTLDVVRRICNTGKRIDVVGLAAGTNAALLSEQIAAFHPQVASIQSEHDANALQTDHPTVQILHGEEALRAISRHPNVDVVVNALVGAAGLVPTIAALDAHRTVALANKESLVVGGVLVRDALQRGGGRLLPIDSEHNALLQCLDAGEPSDVRRLLLTASGGPFLHRTRDQLQSATAEDALAHPTWSMGRRITIDSATMVNKAFEVIEAHYLFDIPYDRISVVIHPESIVHSMVEYNDGSIIAQMSTHDMRIPIQYALTYPDRIGTALPRLDLPEIGSLRFLEHDVDRFPAFEAVLTAAQAGGSALAAVNAADEVLIERFLTGEIGFLDIAGGLQRTLAAWQSEWRDGNASLTLDRLLSIDRWARQHARTVASSPT